MAPGREKFFRMLLSECGENGRWLYLLGVSSDAWIFQKLLHRRRELARGKDQGEGVALLTQNTSPVAVANAAAGELAIRCFRPTNAAADAATAVTTTATPAQVFRQRILAICRGAVSSVWSCERLRLLICPIRGFY